MYMCVCMPRFACRCYVCAHVQVYKILCARVCVVYMYVTYGICECVCVQVSVCRCMCMHHIHMYNRIYIYMATSALSCLAEDKDA